MLIGMVPMSQMRSCKSCVEFTSQKVLTKPGTQTTLQQTFGNRWFFSLEYFPMLHKAEFLVLFQRISLRIDWQGISCIKIACKVEKLFMFFLLSSQREHTISNFSPYH